MAMKSDDNRGIRVGAFVKRVHHGKWLKFTRMRRLLRVRVGRFHRAGAKHRNFADRNFFPATMITHGDSVQSSGTAGKLLVGNLGCHGNGKDSHYYMHTDCACETVHVCTGTNQKSSSNFFSPAHTRFPSGLAFALNMLPILCYAER